MRKLTDLQAQVLAYIIRMVEVRQFPPSHKEICAEFGFAAQSSAQSAIRCLVKQGYLMRVPGATHGLTVLRDVRGRSVKCRLEVVE
jgi:SOS-response transcriptional repressor LexA